jgi:hypothetical protein
MDFGFERSLQRIPLLALLATTQMTTVPLFLSVDSFQWMISAGSARINLLYCIDFVLVREAVSWIREK